VFYLDFPSTEVSLHALIFYVSIVSDTAIVLAL